MSEEMAYTYRAMAKTGLVDQVLLHSHTSQYGAISRGIRFTGMGVKKRMLKIFSEIESGAFAREWGNPLSRLKFKVIRHFAMRQSIRKLEKMVRKKFALEDQEIYDEPTDLAKIMDDSAIADELDAFKNGLEF